MNLVIAGSAGFLAGALVVYIKLESLFRHDFITYREEQTAWLTEQLTKSAERERAVFANPTYEVRVVKNGEVKERQTVGLN
jgi:hypothetical protein